MFRIRRLWVVATLSIASAFVSARAESPRVDVSLLLGDTSSASTIEAVRRLRADQALARVSFHVYPIGAMTTQELAQRDLAPLRRSKIVLLNSMGLALAQAVAPEIAGIAEGGGTAFAVGTSWDDQIAALGYKRDETLAAYFAAGGAANIEAMVRVALASVAGIATNAPPPKAFPEFAALEPESGRLSSSFEEYRDNYPRYRPGKPWVGLIFYRNHAVTGETGIVAALAAALERRGLNVMPFYGYPNDGALRRFAFDEDRKPVLSAIGGLGMKFGVNPDSTVELMREANAPAINLITLSNQTREQWEASKIGLDVMERSWQVSYAELGGLVAPTVIASKEPFVDAATRLEGVRDAPISERIERAAERLSRLVALRATPAKDKRIAILYYNFPPGKENIGASYLNVMPKSLWNILQRLRADGYDVSGAPNTEEEFATLVLERGGNINSWTPGALEERVRRGLADHSVSLLPVETYKKWLNEIPAPTRRAMIDKWGEPEEARVMSWRDEKGELYFVFPTLRFGNVIFSPEPTRGWDQDAEKVYHDVTLPPHHQYLAYYLWLQKSADVHAMVHVGTHATYEWHSGKEVGFTAADPSEIFAGATPQIYPYIVDDVGEGMQAKRRGMAAVISHMTPPLDKASLNPQLRELKQLVSDYKLALDKGPEVADAVRAEAQKKCETYGVMKDLGLEKLASSDDIERLEEYLEEIGDKSTPFGLHTFGAAPEPRYRAATADAILAVDTGLSEAERAKRAGELVDLIEKSATNELDAFSLGLRGGYVPAGPGNDPVRNPASLPTGRNFYGFDPGRVPSPAAWTVGKKLADDFVANFKARKGEWPTKLAFNLWAVETNRHDGAMEAQILALMGVRPVWDGRGRLTGLDVISREELGRPRVDVTMLPTGLYRDLFSQTMQRLDEAVTLAQNQNEPDNPMYKAVAETKAELVREGLTEKRAEQLARVRMFTEPTGAYGANLDKVTAASNTYGDRKDADDKASGVFFNRLHYAFGQGLWGEDVSDRPNLGVDLLKRSLAKVQGVIHSVSSNVYGTLDNDDMFQYLGGAAMAVRAVNGATPEVFIADMATPNKAVTVTLERYIGREMRSRYLNPKWIEAMMKEGYAGARFVNQVVENLWGWQVLTPESIGDAKWQEMYETWIADRDHLDVKEKFRAAGNLLAYQAIIDRMLVAIEKGYWKASPETADALQKANHEVIAEAGVACTPLTCSSPEIIALAAAEDERVMSDARKQPAPSVVAIAANVEANARPAPEPAAQQPPQSAAPAASSSPAPAPSLEELRRQQAASEPKSARQESVQGYEMQEQAQQARGERSDEALLIGAIISAAAALGFLSRIVPAARRRPV